MSKHVPRNRVADPLRALADDLDWVRSDSDGLVRRMREVARQIDDEHDRRMESQRQNYRRLIDGEGRS